MTAPARAGGGGPGANSMVARLQARAKDFLAGFSTGQRAVVGVAVLAVLIGGYMFMSWASKPTYVPLFSNLSSSDAAAITQKLSEDKVPYQLSEDGQQVLVPQGDVYQERLDMAAAGLPSSGDQGYSLLDNAGVTTSEFQQQVEYQQAVSDELEKTIESINGVTSAQVSVVIPQESLFTDSSSQPSASVLLDLQPGVTLGAEQVQAVVHLVASSIEGLSPDNVTVADSQGDVLNAPGTDSSAVAAGTMEQQETESFDQSVDNSVQNWLATFLGSGNAVVQTNATLDFDQTQTNSQIYDPDKQGPIPVQKATSKETYSGPAASEQASGVLGSVTTVPNAQSSGVSTQSAKTSKTAKSSKSAKSSKTSSGTGAGSSSSATTVPSYEQTGESQQDVVSEVSKTVQSAPGAVVRLTVAVAVNSSVKKDISQGELSNLVSQAVGLQPSRGDTIQVAFVPFDQAQAQQAQAQLKAAAGAKSQAALMSDARTGVVVLLVLLLLAYALRRITKTTRVPLALPVGYNHLELEAGEHYDDDVTLALAAPMVEAGPSTYVPVPAPLEAEVNQIGQMIEREPERIAEMLRAWLETSPQER